MGNSCISKANPKKVNSIKSNPCNSLKDIDLQTNIECIFFDNNLVINWEAKRRTEKYHWWPMREINKDDYVNNLYAKGGGLNKYDILFDTKSIEYQKNKYYRHRDSIERDAKWAGFCNNSSILSCLYEYPKYEVCVNYKNKDMVFNTRDIEALMIVCSNNAIKENISLFFGNRNNDFENDDINEPYPSEFLQMLEILCIQEEAFIMDIDMNSSVWNYAYDKVEVSKHSECDIECIIPNEGKTEFYNFKIYSNAYPKHNQDLWGYINTRIENNGYGTEESIIIREEWISPNHPDFLWKKFKKNTIWEGVSDINPEIYSSTVYKIYLQSLNNKNIKLILN